MNLLQEKLLDISQKAGEIFSLIDDDNLLSSHRLLHIRIKNPQSYITVIGETSSGKSTLINGFYKKDILPRAASPTTGTVTHIFNTNQPKCEYYAIYKDGTFEHLNIDLFKELSMNPDKNLLRLKVQISPLKKEFIGLNLFDTPGYDSLVAEHEEILRSFIPESDVIVFVVNYRVGFGRQDQILLSSIQEFIAEHNILVHLVINRCPKSETQVSTRVKEIVSYASDCLHKKVVPILVNSVIQDDNKKSKPVFPQAPQLWEDILNIINSDERFNILLNRGKKYLEQLLYELKLNIEQQIQIAQLDHSELEQLKQIFDEFSASKQMLIKIIEKYCKRWERTLPKLITQKFDDLISSIKNEVEDTNKWLDSNASTSFIVGHHIPFTIRDINRNVGHYLKAELEEMNKEMEDVANQAIKKLVKSADHIHTSSINIIIGTLVAKIGIKFLGEGAKNIVIGLGGCGGIAAGMGNLVKMGVKRIGNLFGKTFSRNVYNNIGKFFTKEMIKKLNVAVMIIIEAGIYVFDSTTWRKNLIKKTTKVLEEVKKDMSDTIVSDVISNIRVTNLQTISELYNELNTEIENDISKINHSDSENQLRNTQIILNEVIVLQNKLEGI
jgi:GTPase Era involved in 16S rRNA processing